MKDKHRADLSPRQKQVAWTVGLVAGASAIANTLVDIVEKFVS